jgi:hypothetical protein
MILESAEMGDNIFVKPLLLFAPLPAPFMLARLTYRAAKVKRGTTARHNGSA